MVFLVIAIEVVKNAKPVVAAQITPEHNTITVSENVCISFISSSVYFRYLKLKKGILVYFDKNVLEYFITLIFIALYEYCIESPSIQFTHRNYTIIYRFTKAVNTLHSTKSTLQKFKNSKYQKVQLKKQV